MSLAARLLVISVAAVILAFIIRLVGRRQLRSKYALLWLAIGVVSVPVAVAPGLADAVADRLGIESTAAMLSMLACAGLLLIVIHYSWELSRLEARSRRLAEEVALLSARITEELDERHDETGETPRE